MRLASHLHRTEAEAKRTVSLDEFFRWMAFDELEGIGRKSESLQLAVTAAAICRSHGAKLKARNLLRDEPDWWPRIVTDGETFEDLFARDFGQ